jgi:hypothetical protein
MYSTERLKTIDLVLAFVLYQGESWYLTARKELVEGIRELVPRKL